MRIKTNYNWSGLCNRLLYWNSIYPMLNLDTQMYVMWNDIEFLDIPYTSYGNFDFIEGVDIIEQNNFDTFSRMEERTKMKVYYDDNITHYVSSEMGLNKIDIKKEFVCQFDGFEKYVGVHIRKGDFVTYGTDVKIDIFLQEMKKIQEIDNDVIFFISYGGHNGKLDIDEIKILYENFNCVDFSKYDGVKKCNFDLIGLSKCKLILGTTGSSYSMCAAIINSTPMIYLKNKIDI